MTTLAQPSSFEERYRAGSPRSQSCFERGQATMPGGLAKGAYYFRPYPLFMERGEGCYLYDLEGRRYVDFANHHTAQILGHNHPAVMAALYAQLEKGIALGAPVTVEAELAEEISGRVPSIEKLRFCNSGTEATLHAIRLARGFTGRNKIAKFEGGYHGSHDVVEVSVSPPLDVAGPESAPHAVPTAGGMSQHAVDEVLVLPYNDEAAAAQRIADHRDELACVIFDPKAGILPLRKDFVRGVVSAAQDNGMLLIFDEIVGFRVGTGGLQEYYGITPDLSVFGKIIGGGFPVGVFGGRADIMDLLDTTRGSTGFFQSGTFSGHPVTLAAGLATLQQLTPEVFAHLDRLGEQLQTGLSDLFARHGVAAQVVGLGSLFSIYFTDEELVNYRSLARADKEVSHRIFHSLLESGLFLSHGLGMNALSVPMNAAHIETLISAMATALAQSE
ncbi:MAG: aspartate aminotransferase family protein [Candidatus Poribacteria bacterium]|nr:aspartate aminotransferase family protein [Candidatus Poribacteria bacterium]